jgi:hypothetical protein
MGKVSMTTAALGALALAVMAGVARDAEGSQRGDGELRSVVEFRDGQSGVAGVTGTAWRVEPDGSWQVAQFRKAQLQRPLRQGRLSPKQLAALAGHLTALDAAGLPAQLGGFRGANPHMFVLRLGDHTVTASVPPGQALTETSLAGREAAAWSRYVAAALIIQRWTAGGDAGK